MADPRQIEQDRIIARACKVDQVTSLIALEQSAQTQSCLRNTDFGCDGTGSLRTDDLLSPPEGARAPNLAA